MSKSISLSFCPNRIHLSEIDPSKNINPLYINPILNPFVQMLKSKSIYISPNGIVSVGVRTVGDSYGCSFLTAVHVVPFTSFQFRLLSVVFGLHWTFMFPLSIQEETYQPVTLILFLSSS